MGMSLRLTQYCECQTCLGDVYNPHVTFEAAFFGAKKYAYCPQCGAVVNEEHLNNPEWIKRVDDYIKKIKGGDAHDNRKEGNTRRRGHRTD